MRRVPSISPRPIRARNAEEKRRRRQEILRAAERLWQDYPYHALSMNQVAQEARLAKGTLYLYFNTKEELFLALLGEQLNTWFANLQATLQESPPRSAEDCAELFIQAAQRQEPLLKLLALMNTVIIPGVDERVRFDFRRQLLRSVFPILELLPFDRRLNLRMLMQLYAVSTGWYIVTCRHQDEPIGEGGLVMPPELQPTPAFAREFPVACRAVIRATVQEA